MLPDVLVPFKHYEESVIGDALDDRITPDTSDDRPSAMTVNHWKFWLELYESDIDGNMKSIGYRELGFSVELLKSGVSLLGRLRSSIPDGWLRTVIRYIYNSGSRLLPYYP